jgi:hypothetical protein
LRALFIVVILGFLFFNSNFYEFVAFFVIVYLLYRIIFLSNDCFVFREWVLLLYAINYILSPLITYNIDSALISYPMKISFERYFELALPGFFMFAMGLYTLPTKIFTTYNSKAINKSVFINEDFLYKWTFLSVFISFFTSSFPAIFSFVLYLISILQYVFSLALYTLDRRKYWPLLLVVLSISVVGASLAGMYHDALMWLSFVAFYLAYIEKPTIKLKILVFTIGITLVLFIQSIKADYRKTAFGEGAGASVNTVVEVGSKSADIKVITDENNLLSSLNRTNQAWIFASTVNRMDRIMDFQGFSLLGKYLESALLPRFLAPDKLKSGDNDVFNKYSGHFLSGGTAMGLGIFADGYISFGQYGVYVFAFFLGLFFSLTFKIVEYWTRISPLYVLLILPVLNYAVRPDCETQTILNHIVKSVLLYGVFVRLSSKRFSFN